MCLRGEGCVCVTDTLLYSVYFWYSGEYTTGVVLLCHHVTNEAAKVFTRVGKGVETYGIRGNPKKMCLIRYGWWFLVHLSFIA